MRASLVAQLGKNPPAMQETTVSSWGGKIRWRRVRLPTPAFLGCPGGSDGKESAHNVEDLGSIPGLGRSPGEGKGHPLQCSCLQNPHGQRSLVGHSPRVAKSRTRLSDQARRHVYIYFFKRAGTKGMTSSSAGRGRGLPLRGRKRSGRRRKRGPRIIFAMFSFLKGKVLTQLE